MITPDPIRAALERLVELNEGCTADHWHAAILAARAALDAAPEGEPSDQEIGRWADTDRGERIPPEMFDHRAIGWQRSFTPEQFAETIRAALAHWGRPTAPPAPAAGEVEELVAWLQSQASHHEAAGTQWARHLARAAALLRQLSSAPPAPQPVAVSERLPEPKDCDAEGLCWVWHATAYTWGLFRLDLTAHSHWLPAHALPIPTTTPAGQEGK